MTTLQGGAGEGVIETYDPSDAVGSVRLDGGEMVRFGRSACSFDPAVGDRVCVRGVEIGPLGRPRASRVDALGPRAPTRSERIVLLRSFLFAPVESYTAWGLACRLAGLDRPEHAAVRQALRDELEGEHSCSSDGIDEMLALARWAAEVLGPRHGMVQHVIGHADDIMLAIDVGERSGHTSVAEAERLRARVRELGD